jgi:hypothetical protein
MFVIFINCFSGFSLMFVMALGVMLLTQMQMIVPSWGEKKGYVGVGAGRGVGVGEGRNGLKRGPGQER